ncbi:hypothetical protein [Streptomyces sp. HPF1205]|uniref:hypothetical protein n=1 Tax=Streptomyces sp. HPF1205 TaxID=2873262 RepID=UPI001CEDB753|nr:hypothetical protein [Streptomyces sp. HPF1205]
MSETPSETTGIHAQYAAQVTADLERNTKEQERVATEIAALEDQLRVLRRDHGLLVSVQQALGVESAGSAAEAAPEPSAEATAEAGTTAPQAEAPAAEPSGESQDGQAAQVPGPRPAPAERKKRTARKKAPAETDKSATGKGRSRRGKKAEPAKSATPAAAPAATAPAAPAAAPTLVTLVREYLRQEAEPRSAAEIAAALSERHPDRTVKANVVRTTVEGLVAKGAAQRTKQGSSVFYVAAEDTADRPAEQAEPAAV